ncbi:MAG: hypothetical protein HYU66_10975 [Armatimonadetes bacterium]|nr:hypothetical protein [Armatimonadota bacterium]
MTLCLLAGLLLADPANLAFNGDFEQVTAVSPPPGYAMWGAEKWKVPGNYTRDGTNPHSGAACFRIHHPKDTGGYIVVSPDHAVRPKPGMTYDVAFWARSDTDTPSRLGFTCYETVNPYRDAPFAGSHALAVGPEWKEFRFTVQEGLDFFVPPSNYLLLTFYPTTRPDEEKTLWLDDIAVTEHPNPDGVRLVNEATLGLPPIEHRLRPGARLDVTVDPSKVVRPATRDCAGISFHRVCGWTGQPYDRQGNYTLAPQLEGAIRDLRLPMTRFYGVGDEPFSVEESLDRVAEVCAKCGIPLDHVVVELEDQGANRRIEPAVWARAASYAKRQGYGFRYWEVGNEVYSQTFNAAQPMGRAYPTPDDYVTHVKAVSQVIKAVQPEALIGLSIDPGQTRWGNWVLAHAAGWYDFVCPHFYAVSQIHRRKFETVALTDSLRSLERCARLNALIRAYNPDREVFVYDTEWGAISSGPNGEQADDVPRNANTWGMLHRAVRMIYYAREDYLRGASSWQMLSAVRSPGFGTLTRAGELPGPLTPVLATSADRGRTVYVVIANASLDRDVPCTLRLKGKTVQRALGTLLRQADPDAPPLVHSEAEVVSVLPVKVDGETLTLTIPSHGVVFVAVGV